MSALLIASRTLFRRPRRTVLLLLGYGLGVGVMVALLAVGDALLQQAQDRDVVAGGDLVLLPEGIDPEVLKVGAATGMFLEIPNARALARQILLGPRYADTIASVSPEVTDRLVYIRVRGKVYPAKAAGILPSAAHRTRSALAVPGWEDTPQDRAWLRPDPRVELVEMDQFHAPSGPSWAEWWYFNFMDPAGPYGYLTFAADGQRRATVAVTVRLGDRLIRWTESHAGAMLPEGTRSEPAFAAGPHRVDLRGGAYHIRLRRTAFAADLVVRSEQPAWVFPPVEWRSKNVRSGYVVPILRGTITGRIRAFDRTTSIRGVAYHDHNWGNWARVTWEWGTASTPQYALLTGLVRHPELPGRETFLALYAQHPSRPGLLATMRGTIPELDRWRSQGSMRLPGRLRYRAANDAGDRLAVEITVRDTVLSPVQSLLFLQMRGRYHVTGRVAGRGVRFEAEGFAETFLPRGRTVR